MPRALLPLMPRALLPLMPRALLPLMPRALLPLMPRALLPLMPRALLPLMPRALLPLMPRALLPLIPRALLPLIPNNPSWAGPAWAAAPRASPKNIPTNTELRDADPRLRGIEDPITSSWRLEFTLAFCLCAAQSSLNKINDLTGCAAF
jgi:hypothetical protein